MSMKITLIPKGTVIYEPDPIHRVTLQFPTEDDAIVFFEWCKQLGTTQAEESQPSEATEPLCSRCGQPAQETCNGVCLKCDPTGGGTLHAAGK